MCKGISLSILSILSLTFPCQFFTTWKSNQNFAEFGWRDTKHKIQMLLDTSGAPAELWLEAGQYICTMMNHMAYKSLGWRTPYEGLNGETPDISVLLQFEFWEPVYYQKYDAKFPNDPTECVGRFVGVSEDVGHGMTYKILTEKRKIIRRAVARTARIGNELNNARANEQAPELAPKPKPATVDPTDPIDPNVEVDEDDECATFYNSIRQDIRSELTEEDVLNGGGLPTIDVVNLLNRTFISRPDDSGEQYRARILSAQPTGRTDADGVDQVYKFRCKHGEKVWEEVMAYNKMLEWVDKDLQKDDMFAVESIEGYRPLRIKGKDGKMKTVQGQWEVLVEWGSGTRDWQPFNHMWNQDPMPLAVFALKNDLLNLPGWKRCKPYVKNSKKFARMVHQARLKNFRNKPVYKYGYQVPRNHAEAVFIDEKNGNTKWQDAEKLEIGQLKASPCGRCGRCRP